MRWDEMKPTEMRRNTEIYQSADVPFTENILPPPVLNTKGGTQRLWNVITHRTYNSSSQQNISGQTDIRSTNKT